MKIGIDVDQVLCDTNRDFFEYFNKKHNTSLDENDAKDYYYQWVKEYGVEPELVFEELMQYLYENLEKYPLIDNAKETILKLKEKYKLYIVTARGEKLKEKTTRWLNQIVGENIFEELIFIEYGLVDHPCKAEICKNYGIDILIEDHPKHALNTVKVGTKVLLYSWPWNLDIKENENLKRVNSWDEIYERIVDKS